MDRHTIVWPIQRGDGRDSRERHVNPQARTTPVRGPHSEGSPMSTLPGFCPARSLSTLLAALALACGPGERALSAQGPSVRPQPELIELDPAAGQACGGLSALECPRGFHCAADASDECVSREGLDCAGVCVRDLETPPPPVECASQDAARRYVEREPRLCAGLFFLCHPDETHFFDECGCGCGP
jgi:hypothetical protein